MLELDVTGSVPISRISTYRPETQAMTGIKELKDQLVTGVYIIGKDIYAMGTTRLTVYPAANTGNSRDILTYGWMPADFNAFTETKFVYVPARRDQSKSPASFARRAPRPRSTCRPACSALSPQTRKYIVLQTVAISSILKTENSCACMSWLRGRRRAARHPGPCF